MTDRKSAPRERDARIRDDLPALRLLHARDDAHGCLPIFVRVPQLQEIAASEAGGLLRSLLLRLGEVPADSGATWMLRWSSLIGIVGAILSVASGCTWQQAYSSAQGWQRNACYRVPDQSERERCLSNTNMSYEDYRRKSEGPKRA